MRELAVGSLAGGTLLVPEREPLGAVLVVAGSSGRVDVDRARLFAEAGYAAATLRYFGGPGQPPGICEIPLETFVTAIDVLTEYAPSRVVLVGTSKGAEAALALAGRDPRISIVIAFAPSSVVWANLGPGVDGHVGPPRSSWTWQSNELPFVSYDDSWHVPPEPIAYRPLYERSLRVDPEQTNRAAIRVEESTAHLLLVAGDDDQLWPSELFAEQLADRRRGRAVDVIIGRGAGHHAQLPGEPPVRSTATMAQGGTPAADAALGQRAWRHILDLLHS